jgi:hypothetical protein
VWADKSCAQLKAKNSEKQIVHIFPGPGHSGELAGWAEMGHNKRQHNEAEYLLGHEFSVVAFYIDFKPGPPHPR